MAKTTWGPAPWLNKQTWLLKDNSVVQSPDLETTTSQSRIRVAGTTKSFGKNSLTELQDEAIKEIAKSRLTEPWVKLWDEADQLRFHGGASPGSGRAPDYNKPATMHWADSSKLDEHIQVTFEYESEDCPAVTATVWIVLQKTGYRSDSDFSVMTSLTYRVLHQNQSDHYRRFDSGQEWFSPYNYYDSSSESKRQFLGDHQPIPDFEFLQENVQGPRAAVAKAIQQIKKIREVEYIEIPVWRNPEVTTLMKFKFKRTNFVTALYQDMIDFVQTKPTLDRIKENYRKIQNDLTSLGIVQAVHGRNNFLEIVEGAFAEEVVCHMIPLTETGDQTQQGEKPEIVPDHSHTVSVDLLSGTIVVGCSGKDTDVLEHWNFERMKAELKGELDAFLGYCRQKEQKRVRRTFSRIVKDRTPEPVTIDGVTNA